MNNTTKRYGSLLSIALWVMQGIISTTWVLLSDKYSNWLAWIFILVIVSGIVIFVYVGHKVDNKTNMNFIVYIFFSTLFAYIAAIMVGSEFLLCMLFISHWILVIYYMDKTLCYELVTVHVFALFALMVPVLIDSSGFYVVNLQQLILGMVCISIACWVAINLIGVLNDQQQKGMNQKQSMEDMLHVVEVVCKEASDSTLEKSNSIISLARYVKGLNKTIRGMNQLIQNEKDPKRIKEYTEKIEQSVYDLNVMSDEIITYTQLEKDEISLNESLYDMGELLMGELKETLISIKKKRLELKINIGEDLPRFLVGDFKKVKLLLHSILQNAIDYTDKGNITLNIFKSGAHPGNNKLHLRIDVIDTGYGIRIKDQEKIFHPFYRVIENTGEEEGGIGLGLYIARGLADLMDGDILMTSSYGKGSKFYIDILQGKDRKEEKNESLLEYLTTEIEAYISGQEDTISEDILNVDVMEVKSVSSPAKGNSEVVNTGDGNDIFPEIKGVNWDVALSFLPSRKIILATLEEVVKSGYENAEYLRDTYKKSIDSDEALDEFKIKIHSIKSNMKMIGAESLAEKAKDLEYAARDKKRDFISSNIENFLDEYIELIQAVAKIPEIAQKRGQIKQLVSNENIIQKLDKLTKALDDFDTEAADKIVSELENYDYKDGVDKYIRELSNMVLNLEIEGVQEKCLEIKALLS